MVTIHVESLLKKFKWNTWSTQRKLSGLYSNKTLAHVSAMCEETVTFDQFCDLCAKLEDIREQDTF